MTRVESSSNKHIVNNTLILYFRMFVTLAINLYTSRLVLQVLGVTDYGIYNIVGGVVVLFSYMNSALSLANMRFLSYEMCNGVQRLSRVFNTCMYIQLFFALLIVFIAETAGIWMVNSYLVIPVERLCAANWVFQFSIATVVVSIWRVPYDSLISAHEDFNIYAVLSILESVLKLLLVLALLYITADHLVNYALGMFIVTFLTSFFRYVYCRKQYVESCLKFYFSRNLFKKILSFTGWNFFGATAGISVSQGLNVVINVFFGPVANAARGIAMQVEGAVNQFVSSINTAVSPQIIKRYSSGDRDNMFKLVFLSSKVSFFLLLVISFPVINDTEYILKLWLGNVPENAVIFTQLELIYILILALTASINMSAQASGNIKTFQIFEGFIMMINIPLSFVLYKIGLPVYVAFISLLSLAFIALIVKLIIVKKTIGFPVISYIKEILIRVLLISFISLLLFSFMQYFVVKSFWIFLLKSLIYTTILVFVIWVVGLDKMEKRVLVNFLRNFFRNTLLRFKN